MSVTIRRTIIEEAHIQNIESFDKTKTLAESACKILDAGMEVQQSDQPLRWIRKSIKHDVVER